MQGNRPIPLLANALVPTDLQQRNGVYVYASKSRISRFSIRQPIRVFKILAL